ncbi:hypothetical protein TIFTF001_053161 [Ficus carica]|uniref:Retrotransposon gag domain-containing protein n=1 Tax=Ficus carica TaxID=3494 RepID=A0AA88EHZ9_FICCA|nr:hypothetical protein TIFTF001_053161 [Ficus carica]
MFTNVKPHGFSLIPRTVRALQTLVLSGGCALLVRSLQLKWWAMRTMRRVKGIWYSTSTYGIDPALEVGASQFGIRAVSCQPTSLRLTSLLQRPKDDVGWCLSLMVATRAQLAQQNQGPPDAEVPPAPVNQPAAPEIHDVDPVIPENPIAPELQRDVTQMTWEDFVKEFKEKYFNTEIMEAQQDEFDKFRQGNLSVAEAVKKFEQLARLCPHLISSERDKVRRMMRMFRSDLAVVISSGPHPPLTVAECVSRAIRAEY